MKTIKLPDGGEIRYELTRKRVKNINMRVKEDGIAYISANSRVSVKAIEEFVVSQREFIEKAVKRLKERREQSEISDSIKWLGREYPLRIIRNSRETVLPENGELRVFTLHGDSAHVTEMVREWIARSFTELCRELNTEVREALQSSGLTPPPTRITIKDMSSRWGSCSYNRGHISLNIRLAAYPRETVLSVLWHEYAHYWHHDHSARFYAFLRQHYPEYDRWNGLLK